MKALGQITATIAIEISHADDKYAWEMVNGSDGFQRMTLFDDEEFRTHPAHKVVQRIHSALDACNPSAVAVPGWSFLEALGAIQWCVKHGVPAIIMSDSTAWDDRRSRWKEQIKSRIVALCSAAVVAGTPHVDYLMKLGMFGERVFTGYDAVDNQYFVRKAAEIRAQKLAYRSKYQLPERYFLASARFVKKKNLFGLLKAYALYRKKAAPNGSTMEAGKAVSEPWHLVLVGDGPLKSKLCRLISNLGLTEFVHLPGFKQYHELPIYYGLASAFVHASIVEQWGLVVNEAMASGLPVLVSTRCGCAADLVKESVNGFTFDPNNLDQLAQLMLRLSQPTQLAQNSAGQRSDSSLEEMGEASMAIISNWGLDRFAKGVSDALATALKNPRPTVRWLDNILLKALTCK